MKKLPSTIPARMLRRLGDHELGLLLGVAAIFCGMWLFAWIAGEMIDGDTTAFDRRILLAMRDPRTLQPLGSPMIQDVARDITALGGTMVLTLLTVFTSGFLFLDGKRRLSVLVFCSVASGQLLSTLLKEAFNRPRPNIVPHEAYVMTSSFPSGHSMLSAVTYLTLGALLARAQSRRRLKAFIILFALLLTFVVGVSRVYLGVHWPSDVLAGWTAGISWAIACWLVARRLQQRHTIESETEPEE